jgi:hypothetical protein
MSEKRTSRKEELGFSTAISYPKHVLRIIGNTCKAKQQDENTLLNNETVKIFLNKLNELNELRNIKSEKKSKAFAKGNTFKTAVSTPQPGLKGGADDPILDPEIPPFNPLPDPCANCFEDKINTLYRENFREVPRLDFKDFIVSIRSKCNEEDDLVELINMFKDELRDGGLHRPAITKYFNFNGNQLPNELTFFTAFLWSEELPCNHLDRRPSLFRLITTAYRNNDREILRILKPFLLQLYVCVIGCSSVADVETARIYRGEKNIYNLNDIRLPEQEGRDLVEINDITDVVAGPLRQHEGPIRRLKPGITDGYEGILTSFSACTSDIDSAHHYSINETLIPDSSTVSVIYIIRGIKECFSFNLTPLNSYGENEILLLPGLHYRVTNINYVKKMNDMGIDCHVLEITIEIIGISREFLGITDMNPYTNILQEIREYINDQIPLPIRIDDIDDLMRNLIQIYRAVGIDLDWPQQRAGGIKNNKEKYKLVRELIYLVGSEMLPEIRDKRVFEIGVEHLLQHLNIDFSSSKKSDLEPEYMVKVNEFWESLIEVIKLMKPTFMSGGNNKRRSKRKSKRSRSIRKNRRDKRTKKTRKNRRDKKTKKRKKTKRRRNKLNN